MPSTQTLSVEIHNGRRYTSTVYRGTKYTISHDGETWCVSTRRLGYGGRFHLGGAKFFASLNELAAGCKAFGGAAAIIAMEYGIPQ